MIKPNALKFGDVIGIVAPSGPTTKERVKLAKDQLEGLGFQVKLGHSCYEKHGYLSGKDEVRARDLNHMFEDQEVQGIICLRGGYGASKILNRIDLEQIAKRPKVFVGYSDITALHLAMNQISKLVTFHGPMGSSDIAGGLDDFTREGFLKAVMGSSPMGEIQNPKGKKMQSLVGGKANGILVGGNLSLIAATMGTPYEIDTKGKILFLEEIGEEPYRVDRMLTQLLLSGKLGDAEGILLGDWMDCEPEEPEKSLSLMAVFEEIIGPLGKPTIYDVEAGHCSPMITLPFGVRSFLDAEEGRLIIEEGGTV
ncbi:S66 peptidase family protein [Alkaliphilus oremlandii]|uniref:Peptidase U61 LD-carboxypeptidase A n=1 Tax=Alkaliphilus oremlandii (strain OhILAs) TaxID=350688 RepID=A8MLP6_ALKOO|nr:LD-carboxypeptidase [Alkaliphilus oremlandii]ABW17963.1 peptidase U61 LD-carboxypeptidase A [Alkaliphilus oremlandii OhILAs]